jgi:two-component system response regulator YesN
MTKQEKIFEDVIRIILNCDMEIQKDLNCFRLAKIYGLNRSSLSRIFKEFQGIYLRDSIKRLKLLRCILFMLERRDLTVKVIAKVFGFKSAAYFIKSFKKFCGITPGKFKRCISAGSRVIVGANLVYARSGRAKCEFQ